MRSESDSSGGSDGLPALIVDGQIDSDATMVFAAMVREVFDATPIRHDAGDQTTIAVWHLGTTMVGRFGGPPTRFTRDPTLVARSGLDQLLVQLYVMGGFEGFAGEKPIFVSPGDVCVFDLANSLATCAQTYENISILVPREMVENRGLDASILHGLVLPRGSSLGSLLGDHLRSLISNVTALDAGEARFVAAAALTLITSILAATARDERQISSVTPRASPLRKAIAYIDRHIGDPDLDVARIIRDLGWSRTVLFRVFEAEGGVERYIRRRRLGGAARDLSTSGGRRRIGEVARTWGFASDAAFSKAFRAAFGISPRAARKLEILTPLGDAWSASNDSDVPGRFAKWLHGLRYVSAGPEAVMRDI